MGGVTDFLFGSPSKQKSSNSSSNSSESSNQAFGMLSNALAPTLGYGAQAGNMMGALLGLPSSSPVAQTPLPGAGTAPVYNPTPAPASVTPNYTPAYGGNPGTAGGNAGAYLTKPTGGDASRATPFSLESLTNPQSSQASLPSNEAPQALGATPTTPGQAGSALENFANSAGMDFLRKQGVNAIETSQAGKGMLQSGATGQALTSFGNNLAKTYLNDYLTHLNEYASLGTKNAGVLSAAGQQSSSSGISSGTGSANGGKNGLLNTLAGNSGLGSIIGAVA